MLYTYASKTVVYSISQMIKNVIPIVWVFLYHLEITKKKL